MPQKQMTYTISQAADRCGLTAHTLRFYDKQGLLPFVERNEAGIRIFKETDFEWLGVISCLKETGLPIKKIKEFVDWCILGDETIAQRLEFLRRHKEEVQRQLDEMNEHMELITHKVNFYEAANKAGTTAIEKRDVS